MASFKPKTIFYVLGSILVIIIIMSLLGAVNLGEKYSNKRCCFRSRKKTFSQCLDYEDHVVHPDIPDIIPIILLHRLLHHHRRLHHRRRRRRHRRHRLRLHRRRRRRHRLLSPLKALCNTILLSNTCQRGVCD